MISVSQALDHVLGLFEPLEPEFVPLEDAGGRVLAQDVFANRDQPPFSSSAMDGYAVLSSDLIEGETLQVIGESAAGNRFEGNLKSGQAVRIFTGAPVPDGADRILIQEDCTRSDNTITIGANLSSSHFVRQQGGDFKTGDCVNAPLTLGASEISLLASMNIARVPVRRKPVVALIATGDELVSVGSTPNKDQIISSNNYGLKVLVEQAGGIARLLPIAHDNTQDLKCVLQMAADADVVVTLGGASVGDYDLVQDVAKDLGLTPEFYKVAMRPGKPLMAGRMGQTPMIGLPGNPVSTLVCAHVFLRPAMNAMLGLGKAPLPTQNAILGIDLPKNGNRDHYMRARLELVDGNRICTPFERQDSSLLSVLTRANCLMIRPANQGSLTKGTSVEVIHL